jgi:hypothetical protein
MADDVSSPFVAEQPQMSTDVHARALSDMQVSGLVAITERGLRILDMAGLEKLA